MNSTVSPECRVCRLADKLDDRTLLLVGTFRSVALVAVMVEGHDCRPGFARFLGCSEGQEVSVVSTSPSGSCSLLRLRGAGDVWVVDSDDGDDSDSLPMLLARLPGRRLRTSDAFRESSEECNGLDVRRDSFDTPSTSDIGTV